MIFANVDFFGEVPSSSYHFEWSSAHVCIETRLRLTIISK
jgi:hypothetical protein